MTWRSTLCGLVVGFAVLAAAWLALRPAGPLIAAANLRDPDPAVRAWAIREVKVAPKRDVDRALADEDADVRLLAVRHLLGADLRRSLDMLKDQDEAVRREAARHLGEFGPDAWPALCEALKDDDPRVRAGALLALLLGDGRKDDDGHFVWSPRSDQAVPALRARLRDPSPEVREMADRLLELISRRQERR